jgi:hypothetical protein
MNQKLYYQRNEVRSSDMSQESKPDPFDLVSKSNINLNNSSLTYGDFGAHNFNDRLSINHLITRKEDSEHNKSTVFD